MQCKQEDILGALAISAWLLMRCGDGRLRFKKVLERWGMIRLSPFRPSALLPQIHMH